MRRIAYAAIFVFALSACTTVQSEPAPVQDASGPIGTVSTTSVTLPPPTTLTTTSTSVPVPAPAPAPATTPTTAPPAPTTTIADAVIPGGPVLTEPAEAKPSIQIKSPKNNRTIEGVNDPTLGLGAYIDLSAKPKPTRGDTMFVRWEVNGVIVATGASPGSIWISTSSDVESVTIIAIGTIDGIDVAQDQVTIIIFIPSA